MAGSIRWLLEAIRQCTFCCGFINPFYNLDGGAMCIVRLLQLDIFGNKI